MKSFMCYFTLIFIFLAMSATMAESAARVEIRNVQGAGFELGDAFIREVADVPTLIFTVETGERRLSSVGVVLVVHRGEEILAGSAFELGASLAPHDEDLFLEALSLPQVRPGDRFLLAPSEYFAVAPGPFGDTPRDNCETWCDFCANLAQGICGDGGINEYNCECSPNRKVCNFICAE